MTWFRIDDSFYDHPKVADLPDSAVALWVRAGTYSARHLTDGSVSRRTANRLCDRPEEAIDALLKAGLWIEDGEGGFRFHDWEIYQPTAAEAKATRDARSIGGQIGNHDRWHVRKGKVDPNCAYCRSTDRSSDRPTDQAADWSTESGANRPRVPRPVPSRPLISQNPVEVDLSDSPPPRTGAREYPPDFNSARGEKTPAPTGRGLPANPGVQCPDHVERIDDCSGCLAEHGDRTWMAYPEHWDQAQLERNAPYRKHYARVMKWRGLQP